MLVLTRRKDDRLVIQVDGIHVGEIVVVDIDYRGNVRLGFDGKRMQVKRKELLSRVAAPADNRMEMRAIDRNTKEQGRK